VRAPIFVRAGVRNPSHQLETLAGSINGRFGELDWVPIHYIHRSTPRRRLAGIYRSSRIGMVTPLRDGMNLVAKEYVAAQDPDDPGLLVLSQFAGAAEQLSDALIVNPYNIEETADVIRIALEMALPERRARHQALLAAVCRHDVASWCRAYIAALERVRAGDPSAGGYPPEAIRSALATLEKATRRPPPSSGGEARGGRAATIDPTAKEIVEASKIGQ
jgi:trehalose 6-phosphate synthase